MIAQSQLFSDGREIFSLLSAFESEDRIRAVFEDIRRISMLLRHYSFRSFRMPEQLCLSLEEAYRSDLYTLYGGHIPMQKRTDSAYLRLEQLQGDLLRVAALRLCTAGRLTLSREQLTGSEAQLCAALKTQAAKKQAVPALISK